MAIDTTGIFLLSALAFFLLVQIVYYWVFLAKPYYYREKIKKGKITFPESNPPVSVIIYAKNETENLQNFLPLVLEQDYPEYEVIVVNDDSSGDSEDVLKRLESQYKQLYHTYIPQGTKNLSRKKLGLSLGIKAAKYDVLLFTEADSRPTDKKWIKSMAKHFSRKKSIVLGWSVFEKQGGVIAKYIAFDYFFSNMQMIAMALLHRPYGANSRNLAYKKEHFTAQKGYSKHRFLQMGEDDLFVNEIATKDNIAVELSPESIITIKQEGIFEWKEMKINRAITQAFYKKGQVIFWRIELWSRFFFLASVVACAVYDFWNIWLPSAALLAILLRLFSQLFVINKTAGGLGLKKFRVMIPMFDLIQPFVNICFYMYRLFGNYKKYTWKYE
jgi:glycosyltransferase involved in cell wall biosynthesis